MIFDKFGIDYVSTKKQLKCNFWSSYRKNNRIQKLWDRLELELETKGCKSINGKT